MTSRSSPYVIGPGSAHSIADVAALCNIMATSSRQMEGGERSMREGRGLRMLLKAPGRGERARWRKDVAML